MAKKKQPKTLWQKTWHFIWYEDSLASWAVNIILAFIFIKFIMYPLLGLVMGTSLPVVAVVSESMDHGYTKESCADFYVLCGNVKTTDTRTNYDIYWDACGMWYDEQGISKEQFNDYPLHKGFSKGDIIILGGKSTDSIEQGDIIVFQSGKPYPIIHRVVAKEFINDEWVFSTKGDHNVMQITSSIDPQLDETVIYEDQIIGVAKARIPYIGWIKVGLVDLIKGNNC